MAQYQIIRIPEQHPFPGNVLPVIYYPEAFQDLNQEADYGSRMSKRFTENGWPNAWRNGVYPFDHFHAQAHVVLGCAKGWIRVQLGGPEGIEFEFNAGDVVLLPAGVSHRRLEASSDYSIIGSYPAGQTPDLNRGDPDQYDAVKTAIKNVPLPLKDPVMGMNGAVYKEWA